jgi:predicted homoserine dehydrogenase-like protein
MTLFNRLIKRQQHGEIIGVAITGAGLIGRGMVYQIERTPGMRTAMIVNRTPEHAVESFVLAGFNRRDVIVADDEATLTDAVRSGRPAVTSRTEMLRDVAGIDVVVEVTGAVEYGAQVALDAIDGGRHIVMMNAETDATVGCALKQRAEARGVVYTNSDGDQPGVLKRLCNYVQCLGFDLVAAVNCKGYMDVHATPDSIRPWAERQNTSLPMTTAFTDGTKMNIENTVLANATGLVPDRRGMHGVTTDLDHALADCLAAFSRDGVVDYTLGGDFGGGVFVIARGEDPTMIQPYMRYLKMGDGPCYLFYRPYHLCHYETPFSVADAVIQGEPTIAPLGPPVAEVVTIAKRELKPGERLDGIGGYTCYGEIDTVAEARELLPIGLAEHAIVKHAVARDQAVPLDAVELDDDALLTRLRREQDALGRARAA